MLEIFPLLEHLEAKVRQMQDDFAASTASLRGNAPACSVNMGSGIKDPNLLHNDFLRHVQSL